jgi:hypothetical protein
VQGPVVLPDHVADLAAGKFESVDRRGLGHQAVDAA